MANNVFHPWRRRPVMRLVLRSYGLHNGYSADESKTPFKEKYIRLVTANAGCP